MRIEFKDDDSKPRRITDDITGTYVAEIQDVYAKEGAEQYIIVEFFIPDINKVLKRYYPTKKGERWKLKILLRVLGIEKDTKKNMYVFDTEELIGRRVVITVMNGKIIKVEKEKYQET